MKKKPYRRTCSNCGKVCWQETNEPDCHVLCEPCDRAYYEWRLNTEKFWVDDFLRSSTAWKART